MVRILRIEVRRTVALPLAAALVLLQLALLFCLPGSMRWESTGWGLDALPTALYTQFLFTMLWPLLVAAGALHGTREHRARVGELFSSTSRPVGLRALAVFAVITLTGIGSYLVVLLIGLGAVVARGGIITAAVLVPVNFSALASCAGVGLGLGLGRLLRHPFTTPAVLVLAYTAVIALAGMGPPRTTEDHYPNWAVLLSIASPPEGSAFLLPSGRVALGQTLWLTGITVTGLLLLVTRTTWTRLTALLPVAAGLAGAIVAFPATEAGLLTVDHAAAHLVCDGPVCVTTLHRDWLPVVAGPGKEALRLLQKLPQHPDRIEELNDHFYDLYQPRPDPAVLTIQRDKLTASTTKEDLSGAALTVALLSGDGTPSCQNFKHATMRTRVARQVIAYWLLDSPTPPPSPFSPHQPGADLVRTTWTALHALPQQQQIARITAADQAQLDCRADVLATLTGTTP